MAPLASIKRPVEGVAHLFRELFAISHTIKSPTGKQVLTICRKVSDGAAVIKHHVHYFIFLNESKHS